MPKKLKSPPLGFKGVDKGKRVTVNPPGKVKVQWAEKGSYRAKNMLKYINRLSTIPVDFASSKRVIFAFDNYSAHLPHETESVLFQKGYFLIHNGGVTEDVQVNDTTYHKDSKAAYRKNEMQLMLDRLTENLDKIPQRSRDQMRQMFYNARVKFIPKLIV